MLTVGAVSYGYDNNGNQTTRGADTFTYDHENRLTQTVISSATSSSVYNGDGMRMSHTVGGTPTNYTWDVNAGLPVVLQDGTNTYVYGLDLISATDGAGAQTYNTGDGLGSTTDLTNGSGTVTGAYSYDVFGAVRSQTGGGANVWQFTGEQREADSSLYFLRARYYDPATGRFLGRDPFPGLAALPATQHSYGYALNNPVNLTDPTGLYSVMDLLQDLRPVLGCTLVMFGFSDFSCIGDYLNAIAAYNDFVLDFVKRFGTLNCLNAALGVTALAAMAAFPAGPITTVGGALAFTALTNIRGSHGGHRRYHRCFKLTRRKALVSPT